MCGLFRGGNFKRKSVKLLFELFVFNEIRVLWLFFAKKTRNLQTLKNVRAHHTKLIKKSGI